ncbi:MAG: MotA/TolQ/ExbB proton channel family protein [Bacteroidaceae bacterium]|nr:MotA/TolQ/ExbB proton channel family protein [Bacteroidaceae bacterium]
MKKFFAFIAIMGLVTFGLTQSAIAQEADESATEQVQENNDEVSSPIVEEETSGLHKNLKVKFIEGSAGFMSLVAIAMIFGLALCIERIVFLSLSEINSKKLLEDIQAALEKGDVEGAKSICRETRGPVASICYQGLMRIDEGLDTVERSVVSYGSVQASNLEKNLSWITLFIAMSPSLGFLGTVIGMVQAFDDIQKAGDISPTVVASGMKVALITTIFGIIVALILQVFYNYILSKVESLNTDMEDSSVTLLDIIMKYNLKFKK